jgi:reactive intermediate/imine deaminase
MPIEYVAETNPRTRNLPRSVAAKAGGFVFVSGQVARAEDGGILDGGIEAQALQTLRNVAHVLALADCTLDDVVKTTVWLADARDFEAFNRVYADFFGGRKPARSTLQGANMAGTRIEIEAVAYKP